MTYEQLKAHIQKSDQFAICETTEEWKDIPKGTKIVFCVDNSGVLCSWPNGGHDKYPLKQFKYNFDVWWSVCWRDEYKSQFNLIGWQDKKTLENHYDEPMKLNNLIVHCPIEEEYRELVDLVGWSDGYKNYGYWVDYKEQTAVRIEDGKINTYGALFSYKNGNFFNHCTFTTAKELLKQLRGEKELMNSKAMFYTGDTGETYSRPAIELTTTGACSNTVDGGICNGCSFWGSTEPMSTTNITFNNESLTPTGKTFMSKAIKYIKDFPLAKEEKLLRKHGLHDENGNCTAEMANLAKDLEAKDRGYKSVVDMCEKIGFEGALISVFELDTFVKTHEAKILEHLKEFEAQEKE